MERVLVARKSMACVAAITALVLAGCGGTENPTRQAPAAAQPSQAPAVSTTPTPAPSMPASPKPKPSTQVDHLAEWDSGESDKARTRDAKRLGIKWLRAPTKAKEAEGYIAVGPLTKKCFIALTIKGAPADNTATLEIWTRDVSKLVLSVPGLTINEVKIVTDGYDEDKRCA